jgi:transposase
MDIPRSRKRRHYKERRIGSEKKTLDVEDKIIVREIQNNKLLTVSEIENNIKDAVDVSKMTINRRLHEYGFDFKNPVRKPLLTEKQKYARFTWGLENIDTDWSKIIFSDEASVWKGFNNKRWVDSNNKNDIDRVVKYPLKVHIWGCINNNGLKKIHTFEGIMDSKVYLTILQNNLLDIHEHNPNLIFQDDNDPKHRSKRVTNWKNQNGIRSLKWPSNSPDLNPIENVWALLKREVSKTTLLQKRNLLPALKINGMKSEAR